MSDRLTLFACYVSALSGWKLVATDPLPGGTTERTLVALALGHWTRLGHIKVEGTEGPEWVEREVARLCGDDAEDATAARLEGHAAGTKEAALDLLDRLKTWAGENAGAYEEDWPLEVSLEDLSEWVATERAKLGGTAS